MSKQDHNLYAVGVEGELSAVMPETSLLQTYKVAMRRAVPMDTGKLRAIAPERVPVKGGQGSSQRRFPLSWFSAQWAGEVVRHATARKA